MQFFLISAISLPPSYKEPIDMHRPDAFAYLINGHGHTAGVASNVHKATRHAKSRRTAGKRKSLPANNMRLRLTDMIWQRASWTLHTERCIKKVLPKTIHLLLSRFIPQKCFLSPRLPHSEKRGRQLNALDSRLAVTTKAPQNFFSKIRRDAGWTCVTSFNSEK